MKGFLSKWKCDRRRRWMNRAVAGVCVLLWPATAVAIDIPFERLFLGSPQRSLIRDLEQYPASFAAVGSEYWDFYYEKRASRYQDYHHSTQSILGASRYGRWLVGAEAGRAALTLEQQNVYTDSDRLDGESEDWMGRVILGTVGDGRHNFGVTSFKLLGALGWQNGLSGDIEGELRWGERATLRLQADTFGSELALDQVMNGFRFPFRFPFRTERYRGSLQITPRSWRIKGWSDLQWNSGDGEATRGFANQVWFRRTAWGVVLSHRVAEFHRFHPVARLTDESGPVGFRAAFARSTGSGDVSMRFDGTRYLHLDDLRTTTSAGRVDIVPMRRLALFAGIDLLEIRHDGNSFFDPWPFYLWDIFLAKRYRLDDMTIRMKTWYAGAGTVLGGKTAQLELSARFEWWEDNNAFRFLERKDILFPFFFEYEAQEKDTDVPFRYAVQLDPALAWRVADRAAIRVQARAMVPFGREQTTTVVEDNDGGPGDPGQAGPADHGITHGGLFGRVEFIWSL